MWIIPTRVKPVGEVIAASERIRHVDVQLEVRVEPRRRQIAAADEAHDRRVEIVPVEDERLAVQGSASEDLHGDLARPEVLTERGESLSICGSGRAAHELHPEMLEELRLPFLRDLRVRIWARLPVDRGLKLIEGFLLGASEHHADENTHQRLIRRFLSGDDLVELAPASKVEVPDRNIHAIEGLQRRLEVLAKAKLNVVEYPGQGAPSSLPDLPGRWSFFRVARRADTPSDCDRMARRLRRVKLRLWMILRLRRVTCCGPEPLPGGATRALPQ